MELFHIVNALLATIRGMDSRFQKSIAKVIPELEEIVSDPAAYFQHSEITIRPRRRPLGAAGFGLLFCCLLQLFTCAVFFDLTSKMKPGSTEMSLVAIGFFAVWIVTFGIGFVFGKWLLRGATCVLSKSGVRILRANTEVFIPWAVLATSGQPVVHSPDGKNRLDLPVNPSAISRVECNRDDHLIATGTEVKTPQVWFRSASEMHVANVFELTLDDLGSLLLQLGRSLTGSKLPMTSTDVVEVQLIPEVPSIEREKDGWLSVQLTQLNFPPECCNCSNPTTDAKRYWSKNRSGEEEASLWLPLCKPCQNECGKRWRAAMSACILIALTIGFGLAFTAVVVTETLERKATPLETKALVVLVIGGLITWFLVWLTRYWFTRRSRQPVEVGRYSTKKGTLKLRFQRSEYTEAVYRTLNEIE